MALRTAIVRVGLAALALAACVGPAVRAADAVAQEAPAQAAPEGPAPLPLARVARAAEEAHAYLQTLAARLSPSAEENAIAAADDEKRDEIVQLQQSLESAQLEALPPRALEDARKVWLRQAGELDGWQATLERRAAEIEEARTSVREMGGVWQVTLLAAADNGAPAVVQERIAEVERAVHEAQAGLSRRLDEVLVLQDSVAKLRGTVSEVLADHDRAVATMQRTLFRVESAPLWAALGTARKPATVADEILDSWRGLTGDFRQFLRTAQARLALHLAIFVALTLAMRALRRRAERWLASADPAAAAARHVLSRPAASAGLIALLLTIWLYVAPPTSVAHVAGILVLVPFFRLLPGLVTVSFRAPLNVLAALWVLERFRDLVVPHSLLARLLLLAVSLLGTGLAAWMLWPGGPARAFRGGGWWRAALGVCSGAGVLLLIATIGNVLGNNALADALTNGVLVSAFLAVLLFAAARILEAILSALLGDRAGLWTARWSTLVRVATLAVWVYVTLEAFRAWTQTVTFLAELFERKLAFGATSISVGNVFAFLVAIVVAIVAARVTRLLLDSAVLPVFDLPRGVPNAISKTVQYAILAVGVALATLAGGLDMARFSFLAGALGVGIGFGLQNVVNNFVSGVILLYERPIQEGDVIEAGKVMGLVRRIGARSSTVRTFDGAEVVVPNATLISTEVVNWTLSDRVCRAEVKVGVAYGSDPRRVLEILRRVVADRPGVLAQPAPLALFTGLGDSSLDFALRFWVADYNEVLEARSTVLADVHAALGEAGIEIPFPQRDLHLRSVDPEAAAALVSRTAAPSETDA